MSANQNNDAVMQAASALAAARHAIALTGAGVSVESGIPDFRGPEGIWKKYPPDEYATIDAFMANPDKVWSLWYELGESLKDCAPNAAHYALAELERIGRIQAVVTQNVDNLHQTAGSRRVIEYHGNARRMICLDCNATRPFDIAKREWSAPRCTVCRGLMKPDIVMFGEIIPPGAAAEAERLACKSDVALVVGTSAQVYPAARLPMTAKGHGAFIIEANIEPTDFTTNGITDIFLPGPAGTTIAALLNNVRGIMDRSGHSAFHN